MKHEANLQFEIAYALRRELIPFELEFKTPSGRLDIAITDGVAIWGFIECKRWRRDRSRSRQIIRYESMGLPLIIATMNDPAGEVILEVKEWLKGAGSLVVKLSGIPREKSPFHWRSHWRKRPFSYDLDEDVNFRE